jgi:hypothetical protein
MIGESIVKGASGEGDLLMKKNAKMKNKRKNNLLK